MERDLKEKRARKTPERDLKGKIRKRKKEK